MRSSLRPFLLILSLIGGYGCARPESQEATAPAAQLRVYVDPATGKIIEPPANGARQATGHAAGAEPSRPEVSTSHEGLRTRKGTSRAGGVILDLDGRFQNELTVTRDEHGNNHATCNHPNEGSLP